MSKPWAIQRFIVQEGLLDVFVCLGESRRRNCELFAVRQVDHNFLKDRAPDGVYGQPGGYRIKTHTGEHNERTHSAAVFIAGYPENRIWEPGV